MHTCRLLQRHVALPRRAMTGRSGALRQSSLARSFGTSSAVPSAFLPGRSRTWPPWGLRGYGQPQQKLHTPASLVVLTLSASLFAAGLYAFRDDARHAWYGLVRSGRAAYVVLYAGLDYQLTFRSIDPADPEYDSIRSHWHKRSAERLLALCRTNGGIYIKLGQHLAAMTYILPPEWTDTMKPLHARCPPTPMPDVIALIEQEMERPFAELFRDFDPVPLGVASLAQVHRATLHDGTVVAVKIQHPPLKEYAVTDMASTGMLVHTVERLFPEFSFGWLAEEMHENLPRELNFCIERDNANRTRRYIANERGPLVVPQVHWATPRVLCMEFIEGAHVDDREFLRKHNVDVNDVASALTRAFSKMIFEYGWVHCDPHPGNILIRARKPRHLFDRNYDLVLLDHGLYRELPRRLQTDYARLWRAIIRRDEEDMRLYAMRIGGFSTHRLFACILTGRSWSAVESDLTQERSDAERTHVRDSIQLYLADIAHILRHVPREVLLLIKTQDLLRSVEGSLGISRHPGYGLALMMSACNRCIREDDLRNEAIMLTAGTGNVMARLWGRLRCWWRYLIAEAACRLLRGYLRLTDAMQLYLRTTERLAIPVERMAVGVYATD